VRKEDKPGFIFASIIFYSLTAISFQKQRKKLLCSTVAIIPKKPKKSIKISNTNSNLTVEIIILPRYF